MFHDEQTNNFKGTDIDEHQILLEDTWPIRKSQYRVLYTLREEMKNQVDEMLRKGVIRESKSSCSAPSPPPPYWSPKGAQMENRNLDSLLIFEP